ncbi:uncharacterized protein TM35_000023730 [Trypanosoma theileri]|uniref:Surface protein TolT n=1 Tax=Trypanosoma theileri TaxID=67003 RepID=A0A1X0P7X7_9TRYP|nr:uncharacterized protein TM35_000023730 [Trypanosoma theileri]ORC93047.1 hypothetical protein TM35_000023730 [Trypanosoma theileri]
MSMLSCRVLCLLAIVLCCVGVAHAAASSYEELVKEAREKVKETLRLNAECAKATNAATEAAHAAQLFALEIGKKLETIAANPDDVNKTKSKGRELIEKATQAAGEAEKVRDQTTAIKTAAVTAAVLFEDVFVEAEQAADNAEKAVHDANNAIDNAKLHAERVEKVLKDLDAEVVAAAEKKKEKQVESQTQEQTNETSLGEQRGHTEGNQADQKQEKQKQHYRSTVTINIRGDNLDALLNGAANNSGMALNDGSSSPALLRVPLLLLLLLSVLGCMAVC